MFQKEILAVYKFCMVRLIHDEFLAVEFYLAEIVYVVLALYDEVNSHSLSVKGDNLMMCVVLP